MTKTLEIADELVEAAQKASGVADEKIAVEKILRDALMGETAFKSMFDLVGQVHIRDDYDYKALRAGDGDTR